MAKKKKEQVLREELSELAAQIDTEGLEFLIRQAKVLIHNAKIDEVNRAAQELETKSAAARPAQSKSGKKKNDTTVKIEKSSMGKNYILQIGTVRKLITADEMLAMVRAARTSAARVFKWMQLERGDVVDEAGLTAKDERLQTLTQQLRENFAIRD